MIHACVQAFNTKSNESSLAFEEHAVAREFTPAFTLTDEFTSALKFVSSVPMGDVRTPGSGEKVLAPPPVCLAPNGKGDRRLGLVERAQRGKRRRKPPERVRLTALGDNVSDVMRNITNARGDKKKIRKGVCKFIWAYPRKMSASPHL